MGLQQFSYRKRSISTSIFEVESRRNAIRQDNHSIRVHGLASDRAILLDRVNEKKVDVCLKHPGHEPDVYVASEIHRFIDAWRGFRSLEHEVKSGRIKVTGPTEMRDAFTGCLLLSAVAHIGRQRLGRERTLQRRTQKSK